jgi:hypothetical protein
MLRTFATACVLAALAFPAHAFLATNDLIVEPSAEGSFHVPYRGLNGASDFWCAAGDYVIRHLHRSPDTRIFRLSSPPRRAGQGVTFSLSSEGAKKTGLLTFGDRRSVTASHARQLCEVPRLIAD